MNLITAAQGAAIRAGRPAYLFATPRSNHFFERLAAGLDAQGLAAIEGTSERVAGVAGIHDGNGPRGWLSRAAQAPDGYGHPSVVVERFHRLAGRPAQYRITRQRP